MTYPDFTYERDQNRGGTFPTALLGRPTKVMEYCNVLLVTLFPYVPLVLYVILVISTSVRQIQWIDDKRHPVLDGRMNANLTLVGFAFGVIGLLVSLFQNNLPVVFDSIHLFSVALASFFGSYVLLYLRLLRLFDTMSEGLTNNGLWAVVAGLWSLFKSFEEIKSISYLFLILLIGISAYVIFDIILKWKARNDTD